MRQITIVARNSTSLIAEVTGLLGQHNEDIRNMDTYVAGQDAYIKLVVENYDACLRLLTEAGFNAISDDIVLLRIEDRPGALAKVAQKISAVGVTTRAVTMLHSAGGFTVIAVGTDDNERVRDLFPDTLVN